jgi:hypothetical protein
MPRPLAEMTPERRSRFLRNVARCAGLGSYRVHPKHAARLVAEVRRLDELAAWRPIETAPKDGTLVLACWAGSGMYPIITRWLKNAQAWTHPFNKPVNPPTHWMPLPTPPEKEA